MQRRAAEESLTDHGKDNSNGRAHVGDAIRHKPGILGFLRQIGFMGATALPLGESLSMIGNLLGHNKLDATSGYAHLAGDWTEAFSARVAHSNGGDILDRTPRQAPVSD